MLLALQPQAVDRVPVEVGRRLERPRERSRLRVAASTPGGCPRSARAGARAATATGTAVVHVSRGFAATGVEKTTRSPSSTSSVSFTASSGEKRTSSPPSRGRHVEAAERGGRDEALRALHREPVLGPGVGAVGQEAPVLERRPRALLGRLVEGAARLHLDVLPVGVGEQLLPDHPLAGEAPDPDLLAELLVARASSGPCRSRRRARRRPRSRTRGRARGRTCRARSRSSRRRTGRGPSSGRSARGSPRRRGRCSACPGRRTAGCPRP